jgi:hypothetical protein
MSLPKTLARIAGSLYLIVAVLGGFAQLYVRDRIVEIGDPAATAHNIRASAALFRAGFAADLVQATLFLFTAMALYLLLKDVHELVARAMVVLVAVSVAIISINLLNQFTALRIATAEGGILGAAGADAMAGLFAGMHHDGYMIAQMFFGLWLLPLGYLVYRSGYFPKVLGVLLVIGCFSYLVDLFAHFLTPGVAESIELLVVAPAAVGELWLVAYLLAKGVRAAEPKALVPVAA